MASKTARQAKNRVDSERLFEKRLGGDPHVFQHLGFRIALRLEPYFFAAAKNSVRALRDEYRQNLAMDLQNGRAAPLLRQDVILVAARGWRPPELLAMVRLDRGLGNKSSEPGSQVRRQRIGCALLHLDVTESTRRHAHELLQQIIVPIRFRPRDARRCRQMQLARTFARANSFIVEAGTYWVESTAGSTFFSAGFSFTTRRAPTYRRE